MTETKGINQRLQYLAGIIKEEDDFDLSDNPLKGEYTPFQIDKFVEQATKDLKNSEAIFKSLRSKVENLTIKQIVENPGEAKDISDKLSQTITYLKRKGKEYYDVIESLDLSYFDMPKNAKTLDSIASDLDSLENDFGYLQDAIRDMSYAAKHFGVFKKDTES